MPYNAACQSFAPANPASILQPTVKEPTLEYSGLTTAQAAGNNTLTSKAVTSSGVLVEGSTQRTKGIVLIVPTDQPQVTFGTKNPANAGGIVAAPVQPVQPNTQTFTPGSPGFTVTPGSSIFVSPCNDAVYAITPTGISATIYFIDL